MNKWIIFSVLKAIELAAIVGGMFGIWSLGHWLDSSLGPVQCIVAGVACILLYAFCFCGVVVSAAGVYSLIKKNIEWSKKIADRIGRRKN